MTWVRMDDSAPDHRKQLRAGPEACWLWMRGLAYSNRLHTDGKLYKDVFAAVVGGVWTMKRAQALAGVLCSEAVGLWHDRVDHYEIHDYEHYQAEAAREEEEIRKAYERNRKREQREQRKASLASATSERTSTDTGPGNDTPHIPDTVPDTVPDNHKHDSGSVPGTVPRAPAGARASVPALARASRPDPSLPDPSLPDPSARDSDARAGDGDVPHASLEAQILAANPAASSTLIAQAVADRIHAATGKKHEASLRPNIEHLNWIAQQPIAEYEAAFAAITADKWCRENAPRVNPEHIRKYWPKYSEGPKAERRSKHAPIPVSSAESFAAEPDDFDALMAAKAAREGASDAAS